MTATVEGPRRERRVEHVPDEVDEAEILRDGLSAHPAARAWAGLGVGRSPHEIRVLKERSKGIRKSAVYWMAGAGPDGASVVAKLGKRRMTAIESTVYQEALPLLPIDALRCYGAIEEGERFTWIFLSDAGRARYSPTVEEHRRAAGRWLAGLHAASSRLQKEVVLPDRGLDHVLDNLRSGHRAIVGVLGDPNLDPEEAMVLERLVDSLQRLESSWDAVAAACEPWPRVLVHGDFVRKNLRVRPRPDGLGLLAFDWERTGWGAPATDLAQLHESERFSANVCLDTYHAGLRARGFEAGRESVELQGRIGTIFRCLAGIAWTALSLGPAWLANPLADLRVYGRWLEQAMEAGGPPLVRA